MIVVALDHIQIAMPKGGEQEAREFYQDILGVPEVQKPAGLSGRGGAWFESGQVKIHLGVDDEFRPAKKAHPALVVTDLDELIATLSRKGYVVTDDRNLSDVKRVFTHDPFGNRIELIQSASGKPA
ncbi:MAG: VOC family protein [Pseudomonadota bacterium]